MIRITAYMLAALLALPNLAVADEAKGRIKYISKKASTIQLDIKGKEPVVVRFDKNTVFENAGGIKDLGFFKHFSDADIWDLIHACSWKNYPSGECIIREGDSDHSFYVVLAGVVAIENLAGSITVIGWDQAEVRVQGTLAAGAELSFEGSGKRTGIEVEVEDHPREARSDLEVHVPAGSHVEIEGVDAEIEVRGVSGSIEAETVNGGITQSGPAKEVPESWR